MILLDEFEGIRNPGKMYLECHPRRKDPLGEHPDPFNEMADATLWARSCPYEPIYKACDMQGRMFVCSTTAELVERLIALNPHVVWLYNAALPLSWLDGWLLRQKTWKQLDKGDMQNRTWKDLSGISGQRYRMTIAKNYRGTGKDEDRHRRLRHVNFFDLMNFCSGGLETCYSSMGCPGIPTFTDEHAETRRNAVITGLALKWYDKKIFDLSGVHIDRTTPESLSSGGIAKTLLLENLYQKGDKAQNTKAFRSVHRMTPELDRWYRSKWLYTGAVVYLNPLYKGQYLSEVWRYDQNNKYGHAVANMPEIVGAARMLKWDEYQANKRENCIYVVAMSDIELHILPGMAPIWKDPHLHVNQKLYRYTARGDEDLLLFYDFELEELYNWYDIEFSCDYVLEFETRENFGFQKTVDAISNARIKAKHEGDEVFNNICKQLMVCVSGKLAEDPFHVVYEKYIDHDGTIKQRKIREEKTTSYLDIRQGAWITAYGRTEEMRDIRLSLRDTGRTLIYADTDCIHSTEQPQGLDVDPDKLGAYKDECGGSPFTMSLYLEKKIYLNAKPEITGELKDFEIRTAGTPRSTVKKALKGLDAVSVAESFAKGMKVPCDVSVSVSGGYVKIPFWKRLANDEGIIWQNYGQEVDLIKRE